MNKSWCIHILRQSHGLHINTTNKYSHTNKHCIITLTATSRLVRKENTRAIAINRRSCIVGIFFMRCLNHGAARSIVSRRNARFRKCQTVATYWLALFIGDGRAQHGMPIRCRGCKNTSGLGGWNIYSRRLIVHFLFKVTSKRKKSKVSFFHAFYYINMSLLI